MPWVAVLALAVESTVLPGAPALPSAQASVRAELLPSVTVTPWASTVTVAWAPAPDARASTPTDATELTPLPVDGPMGTLGLPRTEAVATALRPGERPCVEPAPQAQAQKAGVAASSGAWCSVQQRSAPAPLLGRRLAEVQDRHPAARGPGVYVELGVAARAVGDGLSGALLLPHVHRPVIDD
jgi:hypothetical protein